MFRTFETFLVKAAEDLSNKIICLGFFREEKPPGPQEKACRHDRKSLQAWSNACRPGPALIEKRPQRAARPGLWKAGLAWPLRNTAGVPGNDCDKFEITWERGQQVWERQRRGWEHLGAPGASPGAPVTSLGSPRITVKQSGKDAICGNVAGAPGNLIH